MPVIGAGNVNFGASLVTCGGISGSERIQARGYYSKAGLSGGFGPNAWNFYWNGSAMNVYVDDVLEGSIFLSSDYRIKKDVIDLPGMWDAVKALRPIKYTHCDFTPPVALEAAKESGAPHFVGDDIERWGFVAHELQDTLVESAATAVKDAPDAIQSPNQMTVIAALTKALQEAMARIEALEAR